MQTAVSPTNLMYNIHTKLCYIQVLLLGENVCQTHFSEVSDGRCAEFVYLTSH